MFKVNFIHLSEGAVISQKGLVTIVDIFDVINVPQLPATHPKIVIVSNFDTDSAQNSKVEVVIVGPDNKEVFKQEGVIQNPGKKNKMNFIFELLGFIFQKEGEYTFQIIISGQLTAETKLKVIKVEGGK